LAKKARFAEQILLPIREITPKVGGSGSDNAVTAQTNASTRSGLYPECPDVMDAALLVRRANRLRLRYLSSDAVTVPIGILGST
jgi:hypothetical protein